MVNQEKRNWKPPRKKERGFDRNFKERNPQGRLEKEDDFVELKRLTAENVVNEPIQKTYLDSRELEKFKKILMERKRDVLQDLKILKMANDQEIAKESNASASLHIAEHGSDTLDKEQRLLFIQRDEKYLKYINKALERIENKTYGICSVSGKPIPKSRLVAVPHTSVRIEYKKRG